MSDDFQRRNMFLRGFGDGARCAQIRYEDEDDYMAGWEEGRRARKTAMRDFADREQLGPPNPLRAMQT